MFSAGRGDGPGAKRDWRSPFTAPVPGDVQGELLLLQANRLHAILPILCLCIAANAVAMGIAVLGDLPWWQQLAPPAIIVGTCLAVLVRSRFRGPPRDIAAALEQLRAAPLLTIPLGFVAGLWSVNAFTETEQYYCMVAPVFIGIAALVATTCLLAVPRAAVWGIAATLAPILVKMAIYPNTGVRAMAAMLLLVAIMQSHVVLAKFRETVAMLTMQHALDRQARTCSLTGLDNRLAFLTRLEAELDAGSRVFVALADLDGFKGANDRHGHLAGDAVLAEVAIRMQETAIDAMSVARLGGDEFAMLFADARLAERDIAAVREAMARPFHFADAVIPIGISIGAAHAPQDGRAPEALLHAADQRLYAEKASRRGPAALRRAG